MLDQYHTRLAQDWVDTFGGAEEGPSERNPFGAFHAIVKGDALYAWYLILEVIRLDPAERSWGMLAAAPLEDLLSIHGAQLIDLIEHDAQTNEAIKKVLRAVNQFGMPDAVWGRVRALRGDF